MVVWIELIAEPMDSSLILIISKFLMKLTPW